MVEPINNNYTGFDYVSKTKSVDMMNVQTTRQNVAEKPEPQTAKNQADTVTISKEALDAQKSNTAISKPEEARNKTMEEAQKMAGAGASKNNPLETIAQTYGVSK